MYFTNGWYILHLHKASSPTNVKGEKNKLCTNQSLVSNMMAANLISLRKSKDMLLAAEKLWPEPYFARDKSPVYNKDLYQMHTNNIASVPQK